MLNDQQIQEVRLVLSSAGWNNVMKPAVANRGRQALKSLMLTREERRSEFKGTDFDTDDDVLRAIYRDCEWMTVAWDNEVRVHDQNRTLDELGGGTPTANP